MIQRSEHSRDLADFSTCDNNLKYEGLVVPLFLYVIHHSSPYTIYAYFRWW